MVIVTDSLASNLGSVSDFFSEFVTLDENYEKNSTGLFLYLKENLISIHGSVFAHDYIYCTER